MKPRRGMDSIDDSLPSQIVLHLADHADRFRQNWPIAILVSAAFTLYYTLFGNRRDVVLIAVAAAAALAAPPETLLQHVLVSQKLTMFSSALVAVCSAILVRFMAFTTSTVLRSTSAQKWTETAGSVFIPSRTTHSRFFPKKHSFSYSYLTVGVPVGLRSKINGILSVDPPPPPASASASSHRSWWSPLLSPVYEVNAASHFARGIDAGGLREKLNRFLSSQQINPKEYPFAFLVTAPRFLGYNFNPVSFWYLYSPDKVLSAMILEVNNTFDERRPYLVFRDFEQEESNKNIDSPTGEKDSSSSSSSSPPVPRISASFEKDFHVSPFNSRKGSYSVLAKDPLGPGMQTFRGLDVTINLRSSKGHPKLVARLVNQAPAIEVASMSAMQKLIFVSQWFWIGFATFPRIVKEAAALFYRRSLHVWYRPEPLKQSLGRHATTTERDLEIVFRDYLRHCVEHSPKALRVRYIASGLGNTIEDIFTSATAAAASKAGDDDGLDGGFEMRVLTPVFYSRFVHYTHDFEGIFNELNESQTIAVDDPNMLSHLLPKQGAVPPFHTSNLVESAYFRLIQTLRRMPEPIQRPLTSAAETSVKGDSDSLPKSMGIRDFRMSSMDAYVLQHGSDGLKRSYRSTVLRLFLADIFFFGSEEILSVVDFIWRAGAAYLFISAISN